MSDRNSNQHKVSDNLMGRIIHRAKDYIHFYKSKRSSNESERDENPAVKTRPPRIGLALGCGGAKSLAHIGVIKVLEEHNIPIHAIAGTSMGAYVGALWATGHTVDQMYELAAEMMEKDSLKKLADPIIPPIKGVYSGKKVKAHLGKSIGDVTFEELGRKLLVISADLDTYERLVFRKGNVLDAVHASCAMPGIIAPVEIDGRRCVDGGVADPVPVGALRKFVDVDRIIAVSSTITLEEIDTLEQATETAAREEELKKSWWGGKLSSLNSKFNPAAKGNMLDNLSRSITISQIRMAYDACNRADVAIQPVSKGSQWHQYSHFERFIQLGEDTALEQLDSLKQLLEPVIINQTNSEINHETTIQHMVGEGITERN